MNLFISWSDSEVGLPVAEAFRDALPSIIPGIAPWISPTIPSGTVGAQVLVDALRRSNGGMLILTPESQVSPWVLFECGVFAVKGAFFPLVIGMPPASVRSPFNSFQYKPSSRQGTLRMVRDIAAVRARVSGEPADLQRIDASFESHWPMLQSAILAASEKAQKYRNRYTVDGFAGLKITDAERRAADALARAEHQEWRAECFRSLVLGMLRHEEHLLEPHFSLAFLKQEMQLYRHIATTEDFGEIAEASPFEVDAELLDGKDD